MATTFKGQTIVCKAMSKSLKERIDLVEESLSLVSAADSASSVDPQIVKQLFEFTKEFAEHAGKVAEEAAQYAALAKRAAESIERLTLS